MLEDELKKFSVEQKALIYSNLEALELVEGCSNFCDFCGLDSSRYVPGSEMPFDTVAMIAEEMRSFPKSMVSKKLFRLYFATDPLDYSYQDKTYFDVHQLFSNFDMPIVTAIPKGKEELAIEHLKDIKISISHMNRKRLKPYFARLGVEVYVDIGNHLLHKGIVSDVSFVKYSEAGYSLKHEFYDMRKQNGDLLGTQKPDVLFMFCADSESPTMKRVLDRDFSGVNNVGRAYNFESYGGLSNFSDIYGVLMTPRGVFNFIKTTPNAKNPTGMIYEKVCPENFRIVGLNRNPPIGDSADLSAKYIPEELIRLRV